MNLIYHTEQREQANNVLGLIVYDTLGFDIALYRSWLDSADNNWAKKEMVNTYMDEGKFDTVEMLLAHLDTTITSTQADSISFKNYKDYVLAYKTWIEADSSVMHLGSTYRQDLKSLALLNEHSKGSQMARHVLNFFYDSTYFTPPMLPEIEYGKKETEENTANAAPIQVTDNRSVNPTIKLYPNPAQNTVNIEYSSLPVGSVLLVTNVLGMLLDERLLEGANSRLVINTVNYANGVYLVKVKNGHNNILSTKFIIFK